MLSDILLTALLDVAYFLEASNDSIVDPDAAVHTLESMADELQKLTQPERLELIRAVESRALAHASEPRFAQWLADFPSAMGLRD